MHTHFANISTRLFSPKVWRGFGAPTNMNPLGSSYQTPSGNPAFGFFDDFHSFQGASLYGPYLTLVTAGGTLAQVADTATRKGLLKATTAGDTAEDEIVLQWGRGLGAPFKLDGKDLAFECCFAVDAITAAKWNIGVGLGDVGMGTTDKFFTDADILAGDADFLGFVKLVAEGADWDGAYQDADGDYIDGATKTKLNALHTMVADTYVKLGIRYRAHPETVEWYVNGTMPGGHITPARLTQSECNVANTFPDDVFVTPILGIKDSAGDAAINLTLDWWACAQYE